MATLCCLVCKTENMMKAGKNRKGVPKLKCLTCGKTYQALIFDPEIRKNQARDRIRKCIEEHGRTSRILGKKAHENLLEYYQTAKYEGMTDRAISDAIGMNFHTLVSWKSRNKIKTEKAAKTRIYRERAYRKPKRSVEHSPRSLEILPQVIQASGRFVYRIKDGEKYARECELIAIRAAEKNLEGQHLARFVLKSVSLASISKGEYEYADRRLYKAP